LIPICSTKQDSNGQESVDGMCNLIRKAQRASIRLP